VCVFMCERVCVFVCVCARERRVFAYVCMRFVHERDGLEVSDSEYVYTCSLNVYLHLCMYV